MDTSQFLKGVLDLAVLATLRERDGYGYDILRRLRAAGMSPIADASVYGSLRRLLAAGKLRTYQAVSAEGPPRRYYALTEQGRGELASGAHRWRELAGTMDSLLAGGHTSRVDKASLRVHSETATVCRSS